MEKELQSDIEEMEQKTTGCAQKVKKLKSASQLNAQSPSRLRYK